MGNRNTYAQIAPAPAPVVAPTIAVIPPPIPSIYFNRDMVDKIQVVPIRKVLKIQPIATTPILLEEDVYLYGKVHDLQYRMHTCITRICACKPHKTKYVFLMEIKSLGISTNWNGRESADVDLLLLCTSCTVSFSLGFAASERAEIKALEVKHAKEIATLTNIVRELVAEKDKKELATMVIMRNSPPGGAQTSSAIEIPLSLDGTPV